MSAVRGMRTARLQVPGYLIGMRPEYRERKDERSVPAAAATEPRRPDAARLGSHLTAMLSIFARLTAGERMPAREQLGPRRREIRLNEARNSSAVRPADIATRAPHPAARISAAGHGDQ